MGRLQNRRDSSWRIGLGFMQAGILALAALLATPAHASDERAVKSKVPPVYPEIAKRMRIEGVVKVEATIDAEGKVVDVKIVSGNSMLSPAAADAVRKWRFVPAPAQSSVDVALNFALAQ